jgi:uncharacterized iron-regulated membrane protein
MVFLRQLHRWLGLTLALIVVAVSISGGLLLFRAPYHAMVYPVMTAPITEAQIARRADVLSRLEAQWRGVGVELVKFPRPGMNVYHVWLRDGSQAFVDPNSGELIDRWHRYERLPAMLFELHAHLLADEAGKFINGVAALLVLFMALTGIVLWWPARGSYPLRRSIPAGTARPQLLRSHAATGVLAFAPIVLFVATGALMAFYAPVNRSLSLLIDGRAPAQADARVLPRTEAALPWRTLLPVIDAVLPEGEMVYYYPGTADNARLMFRKRMPAEWHPNGRSYIVLDPYTGGVVQTIDARRQGVAVRFMNTIYPLHAATVGGTLMIAAGALAAAALTWLAAGGAWAYLRLLILRRRARKPAMRTAA